MSVCSLNRKHPPTEPLHESKGYRKKNSVYWLSPGASEKLLSARPRPKLNRFKRPRKPRQKNSWPLPAQKKLKAEAEIQRETAQINLEKAKIEAQTQRTLADAEAYQKKVILQADNALAQKLDAEIQIQQLWAEAYAKRKVPANVFGGGGSGSSGAPVGNDYETKAFMQLLTLDAAKRLNYERDVVKE